jgi:hypothetical protein
MPVKWVTGGLLFRMGNDLDWHIREEHLQRETPPAKGAPVAAPAPVVGGADRPMGRRLTRTAGTSQRRPRGSLPLARGGAGCSAGGDRNPRRGGAVCQGRGAVGDGGDAGGVVPALAGHGDGRDLPGCA